MAPEPAAAPRSHVKDKRRAYLMARRRRGITSRSAARLPGSATTLEVVTQEVVRCWAVFFLPTGVGGSTQCWLPELNFKLRVQETSTPCLGEAERLRPRLVTTQRRRLLE